MLAQPWAVSYICMSHNQKTALNPFYVDLEKSKYPQLKPQTNSGALRKHLKTTNTQRNLVASRKKNKINQSTFHIPHSTFSACSRHSKFHQPQEPIRTEH